MTFIYRFMHVIAVVMFVFSTSVYAAGGVIVGQSEVSDETIQRVYLGQSRAVTAVNQLESNNIREVFERNVLGRSSDQMKAHWSRLLFTGRAAALQEFASDEAVVEFLKANPNAIGYISDASKADGLVISREF